MGISAPSCTRYPSSRRGPNEAWSWDTTKLKGPAKGVYYYLYTILDIYSRKAVAWTVHARESATIATQLVRKAYEHEGVNPAQITLHADRGSPMTANSMVALLKELGCARATRSRG